MYTKLFKLFFKENFTLKRLMGFNLKKSKTKTILMSLVLVYVVVVFLGSFGYLFFDLGKALHEINQTQILLSFIIIYAIGLSIMIVLFRASGYLFYYKDYDILSPLPVHSRTILFAKASVLLVILYISMFVMTLPIVFSYFYWMGFDILSLIMFIIAFLAVPLVPVIVMSFISLMIATLTAKFRRGKILTIVLVFVVFIGIFMLSFSINETDVNPFTGQINLFAGISKAYPPFEWFINSVSNHSFVDLALLVGSHVLLFGLFSYFIQGLVNRTNQRGIRSNVRKNNKALKYQEKTLLVTLVQKEFKKILSSIGYAVNAGFGPVILTVLAVASLFYRTQIESYLSQMVGAGVSSEVLILGLIAFCVSMTYTPSISLSLEGKNFWIIKSLPIKAETIIYSKIVFNLLLIVPVGILSILLFGISIGYSIVAQLILIGLVFVFAVLISVFDAIVNLYFPKFDFVNEMEVVKQSLGAIIGIFGGFTLIAINGLIYYLLSSSLSFNWIALILIGVNLVLASPLVYFINQKAGKIFTKLSA